MDIHKAVAIIDAVVQHFYETRSIPLPSQEDAENAVITLSNAMHWEPMTEEAEFEEWDEVLIETTITSRHRKVLAIYDPLRNAFYPKYDSIYNNKHIDRERITHFVRIKDV